MLRNGAELFRGELHIHSFGASHNVKVDDATPAALVAVTEGRPLDHRADRP